MDLEAFFSITDKDPVYWDSIQRRAQELHSDGCTFSLDAFFQDNCLEHDVHFRTHSTIYGEAITFDEANTLFRWRMQRRSVLGRLSPVAWWRFVAVQTVGRRLWNN